MDIQDYHDYFLSQNPDFDSLPKEDKEDCYFAASLVESAKHIDCSDVEELSEDRLNNIERVYHLLKLIIDGNHLEFSIERQSKYMAAITIIGENISIIKPAMFAQAMQVVNIIDIFPKTDGTIQFDFTFYNSVKA